MEFLKSQKLSVKNFDFVSKGHARIFESFKKNVFY